VVTIHDCIHLRFPQYLPHRLAYVYARSSMWMATHRASRVLTVSETSKRDILRYFRIPESRIDVIYNAIDERLGEAPTEAEVALVRERYQLNDPFVLYAGNIKPHKNLERLIAAFQMLRRGGGMENVKLLIIGDEISKYASLRRAVHRHKLHKHVRFFGFVPDKTLASLYRLASVFVFPSLYEGFGLPPLEAMACGAPVIATKAASVPEVCGDAAVYIDPSSAEGLAMAIRDLWASPSRREAQRARGLARARRFTWSSFAEATWRVYEEAAGARS
jgi:glycosyltransferase involved in cell wall biosynthesis